MAISRPTSNCSTISLNLDDYILCFIHASKLSCKSLVECGGFASLGRLAAWWWIKYERLKGRYLQVWVCQPLFRASVLISVRPNTDRSLPKITRYHYNKCYYFAKSRSKYKICYYLHYNIILLELSDFVCCKITSHNPSHLQLRDGWSQLFSCFWAIYLHNSTENM